MARRIQITLSERHYAFLKAEADRSSVSMAELLRRAADTTYGIVDGRRVSVISHALGRRAGLPLDGRRNYSSPS